MIRVLAAIVATTFLFLGTSCISCTSEPEAPALRPLPQFQQLPAAAEVEYSK